MEKSFFFVLLHFNKSFVLTHKYTHTPQTYPGTTQILFPRTQKISANLEKDNYINYPHSSNANKLPFVSVQVQQKQNKKREEIIYQQWNDINTHKHLRVISFL